MGEAPGRPPPPDGPGPVDGAGGPDGPGAEQRSGPSGEGAPSDPLPLAGTLVVSLEQAVAAPLATRKLADAGARVVKVERPEGDFARRYDEAARGGSAYFVWLNRRKESVALDLKDGDDAALLHRLVGAADAFVQNLGPGAAARLGFGASELRERHPRLVTCDISGYGVEGPYAGMKAYDNLVQAEAGLHAVTGAPEAPARVGISVCDIAAGMHAYAAVLEALLLRARTGRGAGLEVSLFSAVADWMAVPYLHAVHGPGAPSRTGLLHPSIAPYGPFHSGGGDEIVVAVQNQREWAALCAAVLERPALADDPRFAGNPDRVKHREALRAVLQDGFSALSTEEMLRRLGDAGVAHGRRRSVEEFAAHPALRRAEVETADGPVDLPADPVRWSGDGRAGGGRVPELDQHSDAIREEFGDEEAP